MPKHIEPMLATLATKAFDDDDWLFEIKWDGFRVQAVVDDGKVKIWTRSLKDAEMYFPNLLSPPRWIEAQQAIVDGEVVALDEDGRPDFSLLQTKLGNKTGSGLVYQAFDLLYLDGRSLLQVPLEDRKRLLQSVLKEHPRVRFAAHVEREGKAFFAAAEANGLEGIIAKLRRSPYEPGQRTPAWLKIKIRPEQELVVGGWTPGSGNAKDLGAVAVGVYEDGKLRFAGKVGQRLHGRHPARPAGPACSRWPRTTRRSIRRRPRTTRVAGAGSSTTSRGSGRSSSSAPSSAAGRAMASSARPPTRGSSPGVTRRPSFARPPVSTTTAVRAAESEVPPMPESKPTSAATGGARRSRRRSRRRRPGASGSAASEFRGATPEELAALDALGNEGVWRIDGQDLKVTNLDKVAVQAAPAGRQAHHEARADPLLRHDRADDPAAPQGPAAQPQSISEWPRRARASGRRTSRKPTRSG